MELTLTPTSHLVLGLVAQYQPLTPYGMKRHVERSIGHFWSFPHSQLYAEPARLAGAGLLTEDQEQHGRRRRRYRITDAGHEALQRWLCEPSEPATELRNPATLKLVFMASVPQDVMVAMAQRQAAACRRQADEYRSIEQRLLPHPESHFLLAVLRQGLAYEDSGAAFWSALAASPPPWEPAGG